MAEIAPLRGILYDPEKTGDMSRVTAPPYDVVTPEMRDQYHASHLYNIMKLDLGAPSPEDVQPYEWHRRAALEFNRWLAEGVLTRDSRPGVYFCETDFTHSTTGARVTRRGFVCLLRLEEFGADSKIKPHERTFSEHRAERLSHLKHLQAHLSQVFGVFPDDKLQSYSIIDAGRKKAPLYNFTDPQGQGHRMWPIYEPDVIRALGEHLADRTVYIADGHHRYETGLNYRRMRAEQGVKIGYKSPLNYQLVYLCALNDPGLVILPAHRLVKLTTDLDRESFEAAIDKYFDVQRFSFSVVDEKSARQAFLVQLGTQGRSRTALGLYSRLGKTYYLLTRKRRMERSTALEAWPDLLQTLDTVVLTSLIFQEILGMSDDDLDDVGRIAYRSLAREAIDCVNAGEADLAAILNPTRLDQVREVAEEGLIMPRKSTYFYPKATTGLVINPINPFEEIEPAA